MYSCAAVQHAPPNRPAPVIDPAVVPTVDEQEVAPPDGLPPPPPDDVEVFAVVFAVCEVEPDVPCAALPCVAVPVDPFDDGVAACDPPVTGEPPTGADGTGAVPLTCAGDTMVRVGPAFSCRISTRIFFPEGMTSGMSLTLSFTSTVSTDGSRTPSMDIPTWYLPGCSCQVRIIMDLEAPKLKREIRAWEPDPSRTKMAISGPVFFQVAVRAGYS